MDSKLAETTSNSCSERSRNGIQETDATRLKTTSPTLSPTTGKSDCSLFQFFQMLLKSEFRTQPAATAVSATGGVDTTFFSGAHHSCTNHTLIRTFPMLSHRRWLKVKGICVAHFSETIFISLSCPG